MLKIEDIEVVIDKQDSTQEHLPLAIVRLKIPIEFKGSMFWLVSRGWTVRRSEKNIPDGIAKHGNCFACAPSQRNKNNQWFPTVLCENKEGKIDKDSFKALSDKILTEYYKKCEVL